MSNYHQFLYLTYKGFRCPYLDNSFHKFQDHINNMLDIHYYLSIHYIFVVIPLVSGLKENDFQFPHKKILLFWLISLFVIISM